MDITQIEEQLKAPFPESDIEWRVGRSGFTQQGKPWAQVLAYLNARAIQDRLDEVFGVFGWTCDYREWHVRQGQPPAQLCRITATLSDGLTVSKEDGAECTEFESVKGGLSSAFKRAAVCFGIGRYLYSLGDTWADCTTERKQGYEWAKTKDGKPFYWKPPMLPSWAVPVGSPKQAPQRTNGQAGPGSHPATPSSHTEAASHQEQPPQPSLKLPEWWRDPIQGQEPWTQAQEYEGRISSWQQTLNHLRFKMVDGRMVPLPAIPLSEHGPATLQGWISKYHLPSDACEDDKILRAALNVARRELLESAAPGEGIPF